MACVGTLSNIVFVLLFPSHDFSFVYTLSSWPWAKETKFKICTDILFGISFDTYKIISLQYLYSYDHTAQMPPINIRSYCYSIVAQGQRSLCVGSSLMPRDVKPIIRSDLRVVRFDYKFVDFTWPSWEKYSLAFRKWY